MSAASAAVAEQLRRAYAEGPIAPVRGSLASPTADLAYEIQDINTRHWSAAGRRIVGRKIGLTSHAVQQQLGVDQPDFGILFADMEVPNGGEVAAARLLQPRAEAEVACVLGRDLTAADPTTSEVLRAIDCVLPAIEIVDSRIQDWKISLVDTIADNASSAMYVLGTEPRNAGGRRPATVRHGADEERQRRRHRRRCGLPRTSVARRALARRNDGCEGSPAARRRRRAVGRTRPDDVGRRRRSRACRDRRSRHREREIRMSKIDCAILGSGNIGTDLLLKIRRLSDVLRVRAMAGIDPASEGLQLAQREGVAVTAGGLEGLMTLPEFSGVRILFDATSAYAHARHEALLRDVPGQDAHRPDAGRDRAVRRPGRQSRSAHFGARRESRELRRAGDDSHRRRSGSLRDRALRRDRREHLVALRRAGHARQHRRIHCHDGARTGASRRRAARQGDHRAQPGRSAADDAQHGLRAVVQLPSSARSRPPSTR